MKNVVTVPTFRNEDEKRDYVEECDQCFDVMMEAKLTALIGTGAPRFVGLTGPTCSGKTTAAKKTIWMLEDEGYHVRVVSIDDFYRSRAELMARAEASGSGKIDYDSEETIDLDLFARAVESLIEGREIELPHFNFQSGEREKGERIIPEPNDVFLFEGIQVFYPGIHALLSRERYKALVICPMSSLRVNDLTLDPNDIRLLRRLVRDSIYRETDPEFTFFMWEGVRENEEKNIFPHMEYCQTKIDSTMGYELGMLKPFLLPLMQKVIAGNSPFRAHAEYILTMLQYVEEISSGYMIEKSLYKEFIK